MATPLSILCIASYHKGQAFLREAKRQGARVYLVTSESLRDADWPRESLDDIFFVKDDANRWVLDDLILGASHLARRVAIDRIVPLDDFDLEKASALREHLRVPGMGETTTRYFRDKLAMRLRADEAGVPVPAFVHVLNEAKIKAFCANVPAPWVLKPRLEAGTIGIRKVTGEDELWPLVDGLGDRASFHLLERFVPGAVYHVDSIVYERDVLVAVASRYGRPPFDVSHGGGVFTTQLVERGGAEDRALQTLNRAVLTALGLVRGVSHTEFIHGADGQWYFLETSARVGGAHIVELVEAATGMNLWAEWAKVELAGGRSMYAPPPLRADYAGLVTSLARQEWPDLAEFADPEVVWRLTKRHHAGLIVASPERARVAELVDGYARRFADGYSTSLPPGDTPRD
ncbi:MAG: acetyl-CoA carboxylase biotin carboxylase subunit family protein [Vicinamibacterales bacterium]